MKAQITPFPKWMATWLRLAALYNVVWGSLVIFFPLKQFQFLGMEPPRYPQFWQCIGMIVGVYGLGYWWAARNPLRHWPIVAVGLIGKVLGPLGFLQAIVNNQLPFAFGINIVFNDLIWWPSFFLIMKAAYDESKRNGEWA